MTSLVGDRIQKLFSPRISAYESAGEFWSSERRRLGKVVRLPQAVHTAVFAPTGSGKGVSLILPHLYTSRRSTVVVDLKGDLARLTANHRQRRFGHRVVLLDPYRLVTKTPDSFNPLDFIDKDGPYALDEVRALANALIVRSAEEREPHWNDSAEFIAGAMIATVVRYGVRGESRSLQMVRELLSHPQKIEMAIKLMCESDCWGGMLARMGGQCLNYVDKEKSSTLTTVSRHLRFLDTPAIAESTRTSTFDPAELRSGKMTVYLVLSPEHVRSQAALLRMWNGSLLRAVVRGGWQG
jgi:type IV secretion system protein VirD4